MTPIVLAAGASRRMGRPKALLDFDGRVCLDLVLDAVRSAGRPIVVLGPNHEEIRRQVDLDAVDVVLNPDPDSGQTASLQAALSRLPAGADAFFFLPVDLPLVRAADVDALRRSRIANPGAAIHIPSYAMKRGHPILCDRALAAEFLALPPGATARDVVNRIPDRIAYVPFGEAYVLMDMDTPEDYRRCLESYRARGAISR